MTSPYPVTLGLVMDGFSAWWDSVELWVAQLWFPLQFLVVMAVVVPLCLGVAKVVDIAVDRIAERVPTGRGAERSPTPRR